MRGFVVKRVFGIVAMVAGSGALGACGGSYGFEPASPERGTSLGNLLAFNSLAAPSPAKAAAVADEKPTCPDIQVLDGTASSRVYGSGGQSNANVRYQFSMGDVVRECSHVGDELVIKVGVEGRALLGPVGAPGSFSAPVRIAVRDERSGKPVASKLYQVPVTIPPGETAADFSIVPDTLSVPYHSAQGQDDYAILVGFDSKGDGGPAGKAVKKPRPRT